MPDPAPRPLTGDALRLLAAKTLAFGANFVLPLLLVRLLSQTDFGLYKQVFLLAGTVATALPLGFVMSAFYFLPREPDRRGQVVLNILLFYAAVGGVSAAAIVAAPELLAWLFGTGALAPLAPWIALVVAVGAVASVLEYLAIANDETPLAAGLILAVNVVRVIALVAAVLAAPSVGTVLIVTVAVGLLQIGLTLAYAGARFPGFHRRVDPGLLRAQLGYALPLGVAGLLWWLQLDLHNYFVARQYGPAVYAVYAVGCLNLPLVTLLSESVASVLIPRVSRLERDGRRDEVVATLAGAMRQLALLSLPLYAVLLVTGRDLIVVLFTEQYEASWPIFAVYLTLMLSGPLATACDAVIRARPELRYYVLAVRVPVIVGLVVGLTVVTRHATPLAAIALVVAANTAERLVVAAKVGRALRVGRRDAAALVPILPIAAAAATAGVTAAVVRGLLPAASPLATLLASASVFAAAYAAAGWAFGILTPDETRALRRRLWRLTPPARPRRGELV